MDVGPIDFLPDAIFAVDMEEKIIAWNKAIETMTGIEAASMVAKGNHEHFGCPTWARTRDLRG